MWNVLIIGLGQIGMGYDYDLHPKDYILTHAQAFQAHPLFEIISGVDPSPTQCELFVQKYGKSAFSDLNHALKETRPDIVVIALPTQHHAEAIREVLQHHPLAILCEKPLAYDIKEARQIEKMCAEKGCRLYVNYIRRSDPGAFEIKERLENRVIDYPVRGLVWYSKGLFHNGSHFLNLLQYWLGNSKHFQIINKGRLWDGIDPEPDVQIHFEKGSVTFLSVCENNFTHCTVELMAKNGRLFYARGGEKISWQSALKDPLLKGYTRLTHDEEIIQSQTGRRSQYEVVEQLAKSLLGKPAQMCSGSEALHTLEFLSEIRNTL